MIHAALLLVSLMFVEASAQVYDLTNNLLHSARHTFVSLPQDTIVCSSLIPKIKGLTVRPAY